MRNRKVAGGETGVIMMYVCQWLSCPYLLKCNRWALSGKLILIGSLWGWKIFLIWNLPAPSVPISHMNTAPASRLSSTQIGTQSTSSTNGYCLSKYIVWTFSNIPIRSWMEIGEEDIVKIIYHHPVNFQINVENIFSAQWWSAFIEENIVSFLFWIKAWSFLWCQFSHSLMIDFLSQPN